MSCICMMSPFSTQLKYNQWIILIFCLFVLPPNMYAQRENVWAMGNTGINFNTNPPTIIQKPGFVPVINNFGEAAASVCDENGEILFFTDGTLVHDKFNNLMPNANPLNPIPSTTTFSATSSSSQGALIVPDPGNSNRYYIFSIYSLEQQANRGRMYYSVIDMTLNGGLGDVVPTEKGILLATNRTERMSAVRGNACNVWIMTITNDGYAECFSLDASGINTTPVSTNLGIANYMPHAGKIAFSPNREKVAISIHGAVGLQQPGIILADFNATTGTAGNFHNLAIDTAVYGISFSPNSQYLYFLSEGNPPNYPAFAGKLSAYAGTTAAITASTLILAQPINWASDLKRAPDNNIYFTHQGGVGIPLGHSRIENADAAGMASNIEVYALSYSYANGQNPWPGMGLPNVIVTIKNSDTLHHSSNYDLCEETHQFAAQHLNGDDYVWNDGYLGATRSNLSQSGTYWVSYTVDGCTPHIDTFHVYFRTNSVVHIYDTVCTNETYTFGKLSISSPGIYSDTFSSTSGCDSIIFLHLTHYEEPSASISSSLNNTACLGESISLLASSAAKYEWKADTKIVGTEQELTWQLWHHNTQISLSVTDENGCVANAQQNIKAEQCCEIMMPNAFSPNGDGKNDVFKPILIKPCATTNITLLVFNRWGQLVFQGINENAIAGWDGTFENKQSELGVYNYLLKYTLMGASKPIMIKGDVTLLR
jgi:gliding motility-associated-like protein